jgi:hypothetical protein
MDNRSGELESIPLIRKRNFCQVRALNPENEKGTYASQKSQEEEGSES